MGLKTTVGTPVNTLSKAAVEGKLITKSECDADGGNGRFPMQEHTFPLLTSIVLFLFLRSGHFPSTCGFFVFTSKKNRSSFETKSSADR